MVVPFFIYSASTGALLAGVVPTFSYYKRRNSDDSITTLTSPAIREMGNGLYEFTLADADLLAGSTINYVLDCTAAAASRYIEGHVDADDVVAAESAQTGTGVLVFGVTSTTLRQHCFPRLDDFSATTSPTSTIVTEKIEAAAARVAAALAKESITAVSILTNTPGYAIVADIVRKMAALDCRFPADDPETPKGWAADVKAFFELLKTDAGIALADSSLPSSDSPPNGPTTHLTEYNLEVDSVDDMSDATFPLHAKDAL